MTDSSSTTMDRLKFGLPMAHVARGTPCPQCRDGRLQQIQRDGRLVLVVCTRCGYTKSVGGAR